MRARTLSLALATLALVAPQVAATAQHPLNLPRIGYLSGSTPDSPFVEAFRQGLRELGYVEGKNIAIEFRFAEGRHERVPALAAELVRLQVDVIVATYGPGPVAAMQATSTIPIVFLGGGDPVAEGLVASLPRPGGNITGLTSLAPDLVGKQLELLKETVPHVSRVAVLQNPGNPTHPLMLRRAEGGASALRVRLQVVEARSPNDFDRVFAAMTRERAGALFILPDALFLLHRSGLAGLPAKGRLPAMHSHREHAEAGGLMAHGASRADMLRRAAVYVHKILKGAKPADLPVEQPTRFELVLNMKTAKALGIKFPQSVLIRADWLIQ